MTKRMQRNINWLKALHCCSKAEKEQILKAAKPEAINAICDCIQNVLGGNIPISAQHKKQLQAKKVVLRKLVNRKSKVPERKKLLVQHGSGFLNSILKPVLSTLGELFNL